LHRPRRCQHLADPTRVAGPDQNCRSPYTRETTANAAGLRLRHSRCTRAFGHIPHAATATGLRHCIRCAHRFDPTHCSPQFAGKSGGYRSLAASMHVARLPLRQVYCLRRRLRPVGEPICAESGRLSLPGQGRKNRIKRCWLAHCMSLRKIYAELGDDFHGFFGFHILSNRFKFHDLRNLRNSSNH